MLATATVTVDLTKIEENARRVTGALPGVGVVGVTKVTCGSPEVARAMLGGGVFALGESRLENASRLREAGISAPIWLIRAPTPALADDTVALTDVSLESELDTVEALDSAAGRAGRRHSIIAMVDLGDLREGMMPADLPAFIDRVSALRNIDILGIGASLTCYGAIVPDARNLGLLARLAADAGRSVGRPLLVSGGSSTSIMPLASGSVTAAVDNLRVGEAIVLGVDPTTRERILGLHTDAVVVSAPIIEAGDKPSAPIGTRAQDAFGSVPRFEDRGVRRRAICALGRQDAPAEGLRPRDPRIEILGASSDHLVLDVDDLDEPLRVGDAVEFLPGYSATLGVFTSYYIRKVFVGGK